MPHATTKQRTDAAAGGLASKMGHIQVIMARCAAFLDVSHTGTYGTYLLASARQQHHAVQQKLHLAPYAALALS
jgi:hypothetical protein